MILIEQALVPVSAPEPDRTEKGNGHRPAKGQLAQNISAASRIPAKDSAPVAPLSDELVDAILKGRGFRGWLRAANIGRVLGLLSLYLFLDTYDVRANFSSRTADRRRKEASARGRLEQFKQWTRDLDRLLLDKFVRTLHFLIFRGADGSLKKEARLAHQATWLRQSLIALGPTFIKIGQALGTRADLLPLAYVRELSTLQEIGRAHV